MIEEIEYSLLPENYCPPKQRASRRHTVPVTEEVFVEERINFVGGNTQSYVTRMIDTTIQTLRAILLVLVLVVLLVLMSCIFQWVLLEHHIISDPRLFFS